MKRIFLSISVVSLIIWFFGCQKEKMEIQNQNFPFEKSNEKTTYSIKAAAYEKWTVNLTTGALENWEAIGYNGIKAIAQHYGTGETYVITWDGTKKKGGGDIINVLYKVVSGQLQEICEFNTGSQQIMEMEFRPTTNELYLLLSPTANNDPVIYKCTNLSTGEITSIGTLYGGGFDYDYLSATGTTFYFATSGNMWLLALDPSTRVLHGWYVSPTGTCGYHYYCNSGITGEIIETASSVYPSTGKTYININYSLYRWDAGGLTYIGDNEIGEPAPPDFSLFNMDIQ